MIAEKLDKVKSLAVEFSALSSELEQELSKLASRADELQRASDRVAALEKTESDLKTSVESWSKRLSQIRDAYREIKERFA